MSNTNSLRLLVTGGAGYIGSHTAKHCLAAGHHVTILDDLSTGFSQLIPAGATFELGDISDSALLARIFSQHPYDVVLHFAGSSLVGESTRVPLAYFENNTRKTAALIQSMLDANVTRVVFSSTAAVYGIPDVMPIGEDFPLRPINPYGASKLASEWTIRACQSVGLQHAILRYFNAAGAASDGSLGEMHEPETHLIPNILKSALARDGKIFRLFGTDYSTKDGTCVRDYIHVEDLAAAHLLAAEKLMANESLIANLGSGIGYSVREVFEACEKIVGQPIERHDDARRPGDPPTLVCDNRAAQRLLGWKPSRVLDQIITDAWRWHQSTQ